MKNILVTGLLFLLLSGPVIAQLGVNTDNSNPDPSAGLDVKFNNKGFLPPRVELTSTNVSDPVVSPATGLLVYNTATAGNPPVNVVPGYYYWDGIKWALLSVGGTYWSLTGNTGISSGIHFLGTIDDKPLNFRVNNISAGEINPSTWNLFLGKQAGSSNTTGYTNIAIGSMALYSNTAGNNLVAIGDSALFHNGVNAVDMEAVSNTAVGSKALYMNSTGSYNTATGRNALYFNSTGTENSAFGQGSLSGNTEGSFNTAIGSSALSGSNTGSYNTALGWHALSWNTSGASNTATGILALGWNTTGDNNTANGNCALRNNSSGRINTALGASALSSNVANSRITAIGVSAMEYADHRETDGRETFNTAVGCYALRGPLFGEMTGRWNTAVGDQSLASTSTGDRNTAVGADALLTNTTGADNVAIGAEALKTGTGSVNTAVGSGALKNNLGSYNVGIGAEALKSTGGLYNVAIGNFSMDSDLSGNENVAVGYNTLGSNQSGSANVAVGFDALNNNLSGYNTAIGHAAMWDNTTGTDNTALGASALCSNDSGSYNTAVGFNALGLNAGGNHLTAFGYNANISSTAVNDDANAIGYGAIVTGNGQTRIGDVWQNHIGGNCDWFNDSDGRFKSDVTEDVKGLEFIMKLRPVTYYFENGLLEEYLTRNFPDSIKMRYRNMDHSGTRSVRKTGFIAQEVEAAAQASRYDFHGVHAPVNDHDIYSIAYGSFVVPLVKSVQEQQAVIDELKKENAGLKARIEAIEMMLKKK